VLNNGTEIANQLSKTDFLLTAWYFPDFSTSIAAKQSM